MVSPEHKTQTEYRFDVFCRKSMRFEARNAYKEIKRKNEREISLDYLMEEKYFMPETTDTYFTTVATPTHFHINGQTITIENERLAMALWCLSDEKRKLILLFYFLRVKEREIAAMCGHSRSTINYRKHCALQALRKEMERLEHEEAYLQVFAL